MENGIFSMASSASCDLVCFELFAFSVSRKSCPSQDHDRPGRVQLPVCIIWSWCKEDLGLALCQRENWKNTWKTWGNLWVKSIGKSKLRWKASGLPNEGMLTRSAHLWNLTKEIKSWWLLLNLKISPNFSPDGVVLIKSLRLSQIGCLSSKI